MSLLPKIRQKILQLSIILVSVQSYAQQPLWLDEQATEENRMPMHSSYFVYESDNLAQQNDWTQSANYKSLNGNWKFFGPSNRQVFLKVLKLHHLMIRNGNH